MNKKLGKKPPPYLYTGPPLDKQDKEGQTDDIYDNTERDEILEGDGITTAEDGFMRGREQEPPSPREIRKKAPGHDDSISVELAKENAEED